MHRSWTRESQRDRATLLLSSLKRDGLLVICKESRPLKRPSFLGRNGKLYQPVNARFVNRNHLVLVNAKHLQPFEDRVAADKRRYAQEYKTVFHRDPKYLAEAKAA